MRGTGQEASARRVMGVPVERPLLPVVGLALRLLPFLVILTVVVLAAATPEDVHVGPLLAVAPALSGLTQTVPRGPILTGVVAAAVETFLVLVNQGRGGGEPYVTYLSIGLVTATAWAGVHVRMRQERTLREVRSVAEAAQEVLLRPVPSHVGPLTVGVRYRAAAAEARIGGDLYEVVPTPFGIRVVIGDVRGKGLGAVRTAAAVLSAFREAAYEEAELPGVARRVSASLERRLGEDDEEFVTMILLGFPGNEACVDILNFGHPSPLLLRAAHAEALDPPTPTPPVGILDLAGLELPVLRVPLLPEDRLLLYTDGIVEARNPAGEFYPLPERAPDSLPGVEDTLDRLEEDVQRHVGHPLQDDAAMVLLRYEPVDARHDGLLGTHVSA
ncbi:PP2C family protein-serine/threonine phosphatase [Streptomyces sp. SID3343]|uniref:SpoIIE family protein phosphatase n=1 Tax=Streptomyces sp. SID3343 TaxID=2690260 RepID=UPI00136E8524|nr:SpoIIE family protein phosphatase [Streptomyces sp. SID3343]